MMSVLLFMAAATVPSAIKAVEASMAADQASVDACMNDPKNFTQQAMNFCAAASFERADSALNVQWPKTLKIYRQSDADIKATHSGQADGAENLLKGQRAWLIYREANCRAVASLNEGGTIAPMNYSFCLAGITWKRVKELAELTVNPNSGEQM